MDNIILTDVRELIARTKNTVLNSLLEDAYLANIYKNGQPTLLYDFYDWAFKYALERFFGLNISYSLRLVNVILSFQNTFNQHETVFGSLYFDEINRNDLLKITVKAGDMNSVQTAFNGRFLFIMSNHVVI